MPVSKLCIIKSVIRRIPTIQGVILIDEYSDLQALITVSLLEAPVKRLTLFLSDPIISVPLGMSSTMIVPDMATPSPNKAAT